MIINSERFEEYYPELTNLPFSEWRADWLLSKPSANTWKIRTDKDKPQTIYFNDELPDGNSLIDKAYCQVSETIKKLAFLMRTGAFAEFTGGTMISRFNQQYDLVRSLKIIVKFSVSQNVDIAQLGFRALRQSDFDTFNSLAIFGAEHVDGRVALARKFLAEQKKEGNLGVFQKKDGAIDFQKVFKNITGRKNHFDYLKSPRAIYELRDFRSTPLEKYANNNLAGEYTDYAAIPYTELANKPVSESTLSAFHLGWKVLGKMSHVLPELNGLEWAHVFKSKKIAAELGAQSKGRTKTIPVDTALEYIHHSVRFILEHGKELILTKNFCDKQLLQLFEGTSGRKDYYCQKIKIPSNATVKALNIKRYNRNPYSASMSQIRINFSVEEAIDCLVAACYIVIGIFACRRIDEVLSLTTECIRPALDGGWELVFGLEKASPSERLALIGRPVPEIVKMAADLLEDITPESLSNNNGDFQPLFKSSVDITRTVKKLQPMSQETLYRFLTFFADLVQITPVEHNFPEKRRWYLRTHQLRRFFAISYFWHNKYSNLPALTWFMGHTDMDMTLRYVTEEIGGAEMPEEEARYAASIMTMQHKNAEFNELNQKVKETFNVDDIKTIPYAQLENYLERIFKSGSKITRHFNTTDDIVFLEAQNEQEL